MEGLKSKTELLRRHICYRKNVLARALSHLFRGLTFSDDGLVELLAKLFGEFVEPVVAIDLDGLLGCVQNHVAVAAPMQVLIQFFSYGDADVAVQVVRQLFQKVFAVHGWSSPTLFDLKYFARRSRSCKRARSNLDLTAGMLNPNISAVSSVESPSTSRSTNTVLNPGGSP